ncbi:MAG: AAA family ATPase, partial [Moraxellaceae bacterium]
AQLKDERKGAERVNELLTHFFGHGGLRLDAVDGGAGFGVKFQITRGGNPAYHLSEGECSLIAFCYFMAQLDATESKGKDLIIYIDDPISSLDSNHVFFMFSLIETLIARPTKNSDGSNHYRYKQLFISTHNLDFLKYLKTLSAPPPKNGGTQHFIVERHGNSTSRLSLMPDYLKSYVTEFNYLFHQIYKCSQPTPAGQDEDHFYSFGNNLRKFLEAYLFFKYPAKVGSEETLTRIRQFFGEDGMAANVANRLNNELSHLHDNFDRSMRPIDIPEIRSLGVYVLGKIKATDRPQYDALLTSIGVQPEVT